MSEDKQEQTFGTCLERAMADACGWDKRSMKRDRPYSGQPHTSTGERGSTEVKGVTFRDLRDCYVRAWCLSDGMANPAYYDEALKGEDAELSEWDVHQMSPDVDRIAVMQNFMCEVERIMGIYPNVPPLSFEPS